MIRFEFRGQQYEFTGQYGVPVSGQCFLDGQGEVSVSTGLERGQFALVHQLVASRKCETFGCHRAGARMYNIAPGTSLFLCEVCSYQEAKGL